MREGKSKGERASEREREREREKERDAKTGVAMRKEKYNMTRQKETLTSLWRSLSRRLRCSVTNAHSLMFSRKIMQLSANDERTGLMPDLDSTTTKEKVRLSMIKLTAG